MAKKKIVFLTGTRADFGKLKSLMAKVQRDEFFDAHIYATGMHMNSIYGRTVDEIFKSEMKNIFMFINHDSVDHMDRTLARTIDGFSHFVRDLKPDLVIVHGDRVEALAGAIVGSLNNILVAHVEGGELSGTVDETLRHAISKMAHLHFVSNESALRRLCQMGERESSIFVIGSPDIDVMTSTSLPELGSVLRHYEVPFDEYAMAMFHPVTTEYKKCSEHARDFVTALEDSGRNYIVIYPNNDYGSEKILEQYDRLLDSPNFSVFPSIRFESFLTLLRHSKFMIGNSSAGIREAPFYGVPTVDIGSRQNKRGGGPTIVNVSNDRSDILEAIEGIDQLAVHQASQAVTEFGSGGSDEKFHQILLTKEFWETDIQKQFFELT